MAILAALAAAMLQLSGCTGKPASSSAGSAADTGAAPFTQQPQPPALPGDKDTSRTYIHLTQAKDTWLRYGITNEIGESLELLAGIDGLAWALYRLNPGMEHITSVELVISVQAELATYIAVADYSLNRWDIRGPVTGTTTIDLNDAWHRTAGGNYYVAVICGGGSCRILEVDSTVDNGWDTVVVDAAAGSNGIEAKNTSLAVIDNRPAIAYYAGAGDDLKYARSTHLLGNAPVDWSVETVDAGGRVGEYCSLANVNGFAGVSYYDYTNRHLKFARRNGDGSWRLRTIDTTDQTGGFTSLAVVTGKPCISYYRGDTGDLWFTRSSSDFGLEDGLVLWPKVLVDDSPNFVGIGTSIAEVDGAPAIAYYDFDDLRLRYARSTQADGLNDRNWEIMTFAGTLIGLAPILSVVNGHPAVVYTDSNTGTTRYRRSLNENGIDPPSWGTPVSFDTDTEDSGYHTSFAIIGGFPTIAYRDRDNGNLKYALSSTINGTSADDWQSIIVDSDTDAEFCSLAEVDGRPAISWIDKDTGNLMYGVYTGP